MGLTVQNFVSPAVGLAVAVALVRGLAAPQGRDRQLLGRPRARLVRVLLPIAAVGARRPAAGGVIQNLTAPTTSRRSRAATQVIQGGLVASQEAIKELGTNGGGFFNANSAHPFENPNAVTNLFEIFLLLVIPFALPRPTGSWSATGARAGRFSPS